jgi:phosphoglycerate dehydrogenase-like enzyme
VVVFVRLEEWAYENPWYWGAVEAVVFGIIGFAVFGLAVGIAVAAFAFVVLGWSESRGPGRKSRERRMGKRRSSTDDAGD